MAPTGLRVPRARITTIITIITGDTTADTTILKRQPVPAAALTVITSYSNPSLLSL